MKCTRPSCEEKEDRIHGYCSVYCKDIHELEIEIERLQAYKKVCEGMDVEAVEKLGGVTKLIDYAMQGAYELDDVDLIESLKSCIKDGESEAKP